MEHIRYRNIIYELRLNIHVVEVSGSFKGGQETMHPPQSPKIFLIFCVIYLHIKAKKKKNSNSKATTD